MGIYSFLQPSLFLKDPDLIKQITVKDFDHFVDRQPFMAPNTHRLWSKNLIALKGIIFKVQDDTVCDISGFQDKLYNCR